MPEQVVIEHCSPTLAGIKTGNLFSVRTDKKENIIEEVRELNDTLREKGLRVVPLKRTSDFALIYIYRPGDLDRDLNDPGAKRILKRKGYDCIGSGYCIAQLAKRFSKCREFPHEIGLFLGYPPSDVEGFMNDPCNGVKCSGCWKAYSDPEKAKRTFKMYKKCTEIYRDLNRKGRSLVQLTVKR